jgi:hypothetical protein
MGIVSKERTVIESAVAAFRAATLAGHAFLDDEPAAMWVREASAANEKLALAHKILDMLTEAPHLKGYMRVLELLDQASPYVVHASYGNMKALEQLEGLLEQIDAVPLT